MVVAGLSRCLQVYTSLSPDVLVRGKVEKAYVATLLGSRLEGSISGKEEKEKKRKKLQRHVWQHCWVLDLKDASEEKRKGGKKRKSGKHMSGNIGELPGGTKHQCKDSAKC